MPDIEYQIKVLNESESVEKILKALPQWFAIESAIANYCADSKVMPTFFAVLPDNKRIGFLCMRLNNKSTAEIHVMGILREYQGKGIGKALMKYAEQKAKESSCEYLMVKTVGESSSDINYAETREFYKKAGFCSLAEFDSIWPGHPCLIMVKKL